MQRTILSKTSVKSVWGVRVCVSGKGEGSHPPPPPPPPPKKNTHGATRSLSPSNAFMYLPGTSLVSRNEFLNWQNQRTEI